MKFRNLLDELFEDSRMVEAFSFSFFPSFLFFFSFFRRSLTFGRGIVNRGQVGTWRDSGETRAQGAIALL